MDQLHIHLLEPQEPLVVHAAEELQRYARRLFGFSPLIQRGDGRTDAAHHVLLGGRHERGHSDQFYAIRRGEHGGRPALLVAGNAPRATMWAAYELVAAWGVHFLVQGDVFPDEPPSPHLPDLDVEREPVFPRREFRVINDMANSGVLWSLQQHQRLFDQLAKLRFSGILIQTYPHQPWAHYSFRGVERCSAGLIYGWRHPVHAGTIGRELFGNVTYHTNPDFQGAETYEDMMQCGRRFMRGLFDAARARGLEVTYDHPTSEVPDEFACRLEAFSRGVELPGGTIRQSHFSRHGLTYSGGTQSVERYRTPLNPVYVDLMETSLVAHIQAYPDADRYRLTEQEFPPGGAGAEQCWQELDARYGLSEVVTLDEIKRRAAAQFFYVEGRALAQALGAVQTLRLYDILINEREVLRHAVKPGARFVATFFSEHLQPLVERVFSPDRCEFSAIVDYLPARVAERMHTLEYVKHGRMDVTMITTVEDDNVGFLPQFNTPFLHETVTRMREYGLKGFQFRQFDISQHEPAMAYMAEAGWDAAVTPESAYRRYAEGVAGAAAVEGLLAAFHGIESLTEASNAMIGQGFMFPSLYSGQWAEGVRPEAAWDDYVARLEPVEQHLRSALGACAPRGRQLLRNALYFIVFARQFVAMKNRIRAARAALDDARRIRADGDMLGYHPAIRAASDLLFEARQMSEQAIRTWTRLVVDPTDLGTLAGLNAYGHDWLSGKCVEVYWDSQCYGAFMEG